MEIRYRISVDDVIALQRHIFEHSPEMKRRIARSRIVLIVVGAGAGLAASLATGRYAPIVVGTAVGVGFGFFSGRLTLRRMERTVRAAFGETDGGGLAEERVLRLTEEGIQEQTESSNRFTHFREISGVESTEIHTLITSDSGQSYMIPHGSVIEGDVAAFREAVKLAARKAEMQSGSPGE